jgi:hypothetical protein
MAFIVNVYSQYIVEVLTNSDTSSALIFMIDSSYKEFAIQFYEIRDSADYVENFKDKIDSLFKQGYKQKFIQSLINEIDSLNSEDYSFSENLYIVENDSELVYNDSTLTNVRSLFLIKRNPSLIKSVGIKNE